ncbi:uncharacterized protein EDB93DRAFT_1254811 [Suillus bovinus]|uniref:uncharacterized protein n=1 Tax=Suillus bovinus TaxID=48563 RepID=UPI001B883F60|nr:uncharacterized protein EDB93DRAFT_1254811 [Suillus bovinus]KAG2133600.1 hypothetical protein EDB93DRAFT_1254811 [Suillus bovinus]
MSLGQVIVTTWMVSVGDAQTERVSSTVEDVLGLAQASTNQSRLPSDIKATPFCFILYADKTRLSSHGTVKGYPVVVHCANLPVGIRNGEGISGGRVLQVSEDADEEGKPGFVNLKCVIWHEAFLKLLELVAQHSKSGYSHTCYDKIARWLFPIILILSADYEEQCMMSLIRGHHSKCPCPVCLVLLEKLSELSKTFAFRTVEEAIAALNVYKDCVLFANVFWLIAHSDPHQAISFDCLHALHLGMWRHLLEELKKILKALGHDEESKVEKQVASFPRWRNLNHFSTIIHITFSDGNKMQDLSKQAFYSAVAIFNWIAILVSTVHTSSTLAAIDAELLIFDSALKEYIECALNSPIVGLKLDWDFPKAHLWKHAVAMVTALGSKPRISILTSTPETYAHMSDALSHMSEPLHIGSGASDLRTSHWPIALRVHLSIPCPIHPN